MVREHPGGDPEGPREERVLRSEKKISGKTGFPGSGSGYPDLRISVHAVAKGAERATCSQNFRPLAAIEAEISTFVTIIKYRISWMLSN